VLAKLTRKLRWRSKHPIAAILNPFEAMHYYHHQKQKDKPACCTLNRKLFYIPGAQFVRAADVQTFP
jgi:hypothetical protein